MAVAPRVRTASDYRSVRFAYEPPEQVPGVEVRVEYLLDDTWTPAEPTLVRFTKAGGLTACIRARSVVETSAGAVTNSPVRKFCGTSAEPTIRIVASDKPCTALANGYAYSCQWYGVRLSGFEPGTAPLVDVLPAEGRSYCKVPVPGSTFECRKASIDKRGRAKIAQYVRIARTTELTMRAGSVSTTMTLQAP